MRPSFPRSLCALACFWVGVGASSLVADTLYVDNRIGNDRFDGQSQVPTSEYSGPFRTITRALEFARAGDTLVIANTGIPYYESLTLSGARLRSANGRPFRIAGNGAVISGAQPIPPDAWESQGRGLWKFTPFRKGWYVLLRDEQMLPEVPVSRSAAQLPELKAGEWCAWRGAIYYQGTLDEVPAQETFSYGAHQVGLTLYEVNNIEVFDLTFRHFRIDGINAHDRCRSVVLDNVTSIENGRSGLAVQGTSEVIVRNSVLNRNREANLIVTERATADVRDTFLDAEPDPAAE